MTPVSGGGYALAGSVSWPSGDADVMLWRFDANGDTLWTKTYIDTSNERIGKACVQATDGGFVITGFGDGGCLLLMKTDSMGEVQWNNCYNEDEPGFNIDVSSDGGYVVGGSMEINPSPVYWRSFVKKFDSSGSLLWTKNFGGPNSARPLVVRSTSDGGYIITGDTIYNSSSDSGRVYIAKLDSAGDMEWGHPYGPVTLVSLGLMVRELGDGSYIVAAGVGGGYDPLVGLRNALIKVGPQGDSLWMRYLEPCFPNPIGNNYFRDVQATDDGGFIVTGWHTGKCATSQNIWVVKTNCLGFPEPPTPYFTYERNQQYVDFTNMSRYSDSIRVSFGDGDTAMIANPLYSYAAALLPDLDTANYFTHTYPDTGTYIVSATGWACGDTGVFTDSIYIPNYVGIEDNNSVVSKLSVHPNPTTGLININGLPQNEYIKIRVYNILGEQVYSPHTKDHTIDLSHLPGGIYMIHIEQDEYVLRTKIILLK